MNYQQRYRQRVQSAAKPKAVNDGKPWSNKDDRIIRENLKKSDVELAAMLGRTPLAVGQHRYMMEIRKRDQTERQAPTVFQAHADRAITRITFEHVAATLTVYYPAGTPDLVLERAFESEGYDRAVYLQWQKEKVNV